MTFSTELRKEADSIYNAIFDHPFVRGLAKGDIPKGAVEHYVKADFEYLNAFMHMYGLAISKSSDRSDMDFYKQQIDFVLNSEIHPHNNLCQYIGINYDDLQSYPLPPSADHYIKHMKHYGHEGSLGEILAAILPCPWTYLEIGERLIEEIGHDEAHPFYEWIAFYAEEGIRETTDDIRKRLDDWAEGASQREKEAMKEAFIKSSQLEWGFWEMAYNEESWELVPRQAVTTYE
ncbi:TenA family transcriptional regulator [Pontibacillus halophilus JSM 076056 = DSM 19796]|uniref:Aminopyrimidine aminohydrolase n=1 Tax=Pontibacillus halophilus JSM 076056 = DSM 19796 TaxID=1385510 RepID=A0A0A5GRU6_9BACI|nr:thiaminase II [Pontibacillus halophilus]KGX93963.1 TenA family transcriptional regulator [Pontibacillus halophilus JSM 076056 = DSM 19796]